FKILDADRLTFETHAVFANQFSDNRGGLAGARQRLPIRDTVLGFDLHLVARPKPQDETPAGNVGHRGGRHRDRRRAANENAADTSAELDAGGPRSACRQNRELVAAMPFGYPGRLVADALGQDDEIDDLGRVRAARNCDADPAHSVPPLMAPPLNIRYEARLNIVRAFEQIGVELFAEPGDGIFVWARFHSGGIGGFGSFPIWPAGEVHPSKAVINGLTHPTLRLFQFCRW